MKTFLKNNYDFIENPIPVSKVLKFLAKNEIMVSKNSLKIILKI